MLQCDVLNLSGEKETNLNAWSYLANIAKPGVSLTAPNRDHFALVSLTVLDNFFGCNGQS